MTKDKDPKVYAIKEWPLVFESPESKKYDNFRYVRFPNKMDGKSLRRIVSQERPNCYIIPSCWMFMVEIVSRHDRLHRGIFYDDDRALDYEDIAIMIGGQYTEDNVKMTLDYLMSERIGWIIHAPLSAVLRHYEECYALLENKYPKKKYKIGFDHENRAFTGITDKDMETWKKAFPAVVIDAELKKAALWLHDHPDRDKKNYGGYLSRWFGREQDKGGMYRGSGGGVKRRTREVEAEL